MYAKLGALPKAREVFTELQVRHVDSWTALLIGYFQFGPNAKALTCVKQISCEGWISNVVTLDRILQACGSAGDAVNGRQVHVESVQQGLQRVGTILGTAFVELYATCGVLSKAQEVLEELPARDVFTWTSLLAGYAEHGQGADALECFKQKQGEGIRPNVVTFLCSLKSCGNIRDQCKGLELHSPNARSGLFKRELALGNSLVDMYIRCGSLAAAHEVFNVLRSGDVVSWTTLITGYLEHGYSEESYTFLDQMLLTHVCAYGLAVEFWVPSKTSKGVGEIWWIGSMVRRKDAWREKNVQVLLMLGDGQQFPFDPRGGQAP